MLAGCGDTGSGDDANNSSSNSANSSQDDSNGGDDSSSKMIKVGIINNDPNESGYRTAYANEFSFH